MLTGLFTKFLGYIKCVFAHTQYKNKQLIILYSITTVHVNRISITVLGVFFSQSINRLLYKNIFQAKRLFFYNRRNRRNRRNIVIVDDYSFDLCCRLY